MALRPAPARVLVPLGLSAQGQNRGGDLPGGTDGVAAQIQVGSAGLSVPQGFDWEGGGVLDREGLTEEDGRCR
jgi:hypothetical protein